MNGCISVEHSLWQQSSWSYDTFFLFEICNTSSAASSLGVMQQWGHFSQRGKRSPLTFSLVWEAPRLGPREEREAERHGRMKNEGVRALLQG